MGNEYKAVPPVNVTPIDVLAEPLKRVRELAIKELGVMLASLFDNADDALFELADKANSNADQTLYFDAMREVRIKRETMEALFNQKVAEGFRLLYVPDIDGEKRGADESFEAESLSLVHDDELEETVAVRGMISKVISRCKDTLPYLTHRIDHLLPTIKITDQNNPVGPARLCEIFRIASAELALDIRSRLVVYKLFDKFVMGELAGLYEKENALLIEKQVLPKLKLGVSERKTKQRSSGSALETTPHATASIESESQDDDEAEIIELLRSLLADRKPSHNKQGPNMPVADTGPRLSQTELVELLSSVQQQSYESSELVNIRTQQVDVRQALYNLLVSDRQSEQPRAIGRLDDDVINLVSMLFEFILDDQNLPTPMKALLARLQIPLLKVAVLDTSFFGRGGHPARKLLNELATAAMRWSETVDLVRDPLYGKIKYTVEKVLDDFVDDTEIFSTLLTEFLDFVAAERRRSELVEQRTRDAEEGLGKTQMARNIVSDLLDKKMADKNLPNVAQELLRDGWSSYLFLIQVKQGVESGEWQEALETVDDLIWSVAPAEDKAHRGKLLKMIPSLLQRLRKGLVSVAFNKVKMRTLFKELEVIHLDCLKQQGRVVGRKHTKPVKVADKQKVEVKDTEEPSQEVNSDALPDTEPANEVDEHLSRVDSMSAGTWVEIVDSEGKHRAKLAAVIKATGKYIFVNRLGMKVAEKTRITLADDLRQGVINVLDDTLLFDRALESVIGQLREKNN